MFKEVVIKEIRFSETLAVMVDMTCSKRDIAIMLWIVGMCCW